MSKKYGIFTKPIHVEKLVNFLNEHTDIDYIISTRKEELYAFSFDIGVSYCFPFVVDINYPLRSKKPWFNYHPAPLPEYPGLHNYVDAVRDRVTKYGVTLHHMSMDIDRGGIINFKKFKLDSVPVNTDELGSITHYYLFQLFKETIEKLEENERK